MWVAIDRGEWSDIPLQKLELTVLIGMRLADKRSLPSVSVSARLG